MTDPVLTVQTFIKHRAMITQGQRILAACSGGPDSMALLHLLLSVRNRLPFDVAAAHVNHGTRGEMSDRDEKFVLDHARSLHLPAASMRIEPGLADSENAGRKLRYEMLEQMRIELGCDKIATGHHADDQAETVLFFALRGSGIDGLSGIPPVRGHIIRPLLNLRKSEIKQYLTDNGVAYVEDHTNAEPVFTRNRLRLLMADLENIVPGAVSNLCGLSERADEISQVLRKMAEDFLERCALLQDTRWVLDAAAFHGEPPAMRRIVLHRFLERIYPSDRMVEKPHVDALENAVTGAKGPVRIACGFTAVFQSGQVIVSRD